MGDDEELQDFVSSMGLAFLPWWFFCLKNQLSARWQKRAQKKPYLWKEILFLLFSSKG